ncbi:MAG: UDP-3-O-(3-hydroxymyristoyl)glucosamine N-acyltransferase [Akkermansiaceae bacterium]
MSLGWKKLHELIGIAPNQENDAVYTGVNSLDEAKPGEVSFLGNPRYQPQLQKTKASLVLVPVGNFSTPESSHLITVDNPSAAFSTIIDFFQSKSSVFEPGVSPGVHIADDVDFDPAKVQIAAGAVIGAGSKIGDGSVIGAGCLIGRDVVIGKDCLLHSGSIVREACLIGNRVILQPGCVIGADGYGFELVDGKHQKVPQVGIVEIEDDVEIGANSCVDRARFGKTVVGEGSKIDNLVQIAHNVRIGKHCLVVAQSGLAGSSRLGNYVTIAAQAGVGGHIEVAGQSVLTAKAALFRTVSEPGVFMGSPARPIKEEQRKRAALSRLPKLREELGILKKKLEELCGE